MFVSALQCLCECFSVCVSVAVFVSVLQCPCQCRSVCVSVEVFVPVLTLAYAIDGTNLNAVEHCTYQGSVISIYATVSKNLDNRLSKASSSFGRLAKRVWQSYSLRLSTKAQVYRAVVVPTPVYGAET